MADDAPRALLRRWLPDRVVAFSRVASGGSTAVYRVVDATTEEVSYLRLAETAGESRAAEAQVHQVLHAAGLPVPEILNWEARPLELDRSAMLTSRIPGRALLDLAGLDAASIDAAARAAGRDLARLNRVPVRGFGWVTTVSAPDDALVAEHASRSAWTAEYHLAAEIAASGLLEPRVIDQLWMRLDRWRRRPDVATSHLAHGDFDASHIFVRTDDSALTYSGIIDFGEIRGADRLYDLGHALVQDVQPDRPSIFAPLLAGYQEITPLPADGLAAITDQAVAISARQLAIFHRRAAPVTATGWLARRLTTLLATPDESPGPGSEAGSWCPPGPVNITGHR